MLIREFTVSSIPRMIVCKIIGSILFLVNMVANQPVHNQQVHHGQDIDILTVSSVLDIGQETTTLLGELIAGRNFRGIFRFY